MEANLTGVDLSEANLTKANLRGAILVNANVDKTKVSESSIYRINVWDLHGEFEEQKDLTVTPPDAPVVTVDNIKDCSIHLSDPGKCRNGVSSIRFI